MIYVILITNLKIIYWRKNETWLKSFWKLSVSLFFTGDLGLSPEMYNQLRMLQKKAKELKTDIKFLRRSVQAQAHTVRETLRDTFLRFKWVSIWMKWICYVCVVKCDKYILDAIFCSSLSVLLICRVFRVVTMSGNDQWMEGDPEKSRIRRDEELYKQEVMKLEKDLSWVYKFIFLFLLRLSPTALRKISLLSNFIIFTFSCPSCLWLCNVYVTQK